MLSKHNSTGLNYDNKEFKNILNGGGKQFENGSDFKKVRPQNILDGFSCCCKFSGKHFRNELFLL